MLASYTLITTEKVTITVQTTGDAADIILEAAEKLFAEKGYDGVSMRLVAESAAVSKASVFHHFSSKQELYSVVLKRASLEFNSLISELDSESGDLRSRLAVFAEKHLACIFEKPMLSQLLLRETLTPGSEESYVTAAGILGESFTQLVNILSDEKKNELLKPETDSSLLAYLLIASNVFFFQSQIFMYHLKEFDFSNKQKDYTKNVVNFLLDGVLNKSAPDLKK